MIDDFFKKNKQEFFQLLKFLFVLFLCFSFFNTLLDSDFVKKDIILSRLDSLFNILFILFSYLFVDFLLLKFGGIEKNKILNKNKNFFNKFLKTFIFTSFLLSFSLILIIIKYNFYLQQDIINLHKDFVNEYLDKKDDIISILFISCLVLIISFICLKNKLKNIHIFFISIICIFIFIKYLNPQDTVSLLLPIKEFSIDIYNDEKRSFFYITIVKSIEFIFINMTIFTSLIYMYYNNSVFIFNKLNVNINEIVFLLFIIVLIIEILYNFSLLMNSLMFFDFNIDYVNNQLYEISITTLFLYIITSTILSLIEKKKLILIVFIILLFLMFFFCIFNEYFDYRFILFCFLIFFIFMPKLISKLDDNLKYEAFNYFYIIFNYLTILMFISILTILINNINLLNTLDNIFSIIAPFTIVCFFYNLDFEHKERTYFYKTCSLTCSLLIKLFKN